MPSPDFAPGQCILPSTIINLEGLSMNIQRENSDYHIVNITDFSLHFSVFKCTCGSMVYSEYKREYSTSSMLDLS